MENKNLPPALIRKSNAEKIFLNNSSSLITSKVLLKHLFDSFAPIRKITQSYLSEAKTIPVRRIHFFLVISRIFHDSLTCTCLSLPASLPPSLSLSLHSKETKIMDERKNKTVVIRIVVALADSHRVQNKICILKDDTIHRINIWLTLHTHNLLTVWFSPNATGTFIKIVDSKRRKNTWYHCTRIKKLYVSS